MAIRIPTLITESFDSNLEDAYEKATQYLKHNCVDDNILKSDFELEVNKIFREFNLEAEQEDYDHIALTLDYLNCTIEERFKTFDKFKVNEGTWSVPTSTDNAKRLKKLIDKLENDKKFVFSLSPKGDKYTKDDLYKLLGDDGLFDQIGDLESKGNLDNKKVSKIIKDTLKIFLKQYSEDPSSFKDKFTEKSLEILNNIK